MSQPRGCTAASSALKLNNKAFPQIPGPLRPSVSLPDPERATARHALPSTGRSSTGQTRRPREAADSGLRLRTFPAPGARALNSEARHRAVQTPVATPKMMATGAACHLGAKALKGGVGDHGAGPGKFGRLTCSSRCHRCSSLRGQHGASSFSRSSRGAEDRSGLRRPWRRETGGAWTSGETEKEERVERAYSL